MVLYIRLFGWFCKTGEVIFQTVLILLEQAMVAQNSFIKPLVPVHILVSIISSRYIAYVLFIEAVHNTYFAVML